MQTADRDVASQAHSSKRGGLLLCFYGDDFTGSTDALEFLTRAGARAVLFIEPPTAERLARYPGLDAVGVAGMTRAMPTAAIEPTLRPALTALRALGAAHVHYKVCSTFDSSAAIGSIGRVIDLAIPIFGSRFVPLLVGAPALGRHCVFGNLFARVGADEERFRLDRHPSMSKHPVTPALESDLRLHLAQQTNRRIGLFDILKAALPAPEQRAALEAILNAGAEIVLFDVLYENQLPALGRLIDIYSQERPLFSVGSSGIEMALGAHWAAQGRLTPQSLRRPSNRTEPLLVGSGSCSPVTAAQLAWGLAHGMSEVGLDTVALATASQRQESIQKASQAVVNHLQNGRGVVVHTSRGPDDTRLQATTELLAQRGLDPHAAKTLAGQILGEALGTVLRTALSQTRLKRVVLAGGDTSGHAARALGIEALEMIAPIAPGAPLCRAFAPGSPTDGVELNFKGGQVGGPDYLGEL